MVDISGAPDGATHYARKGKCHFVWYKSSGDGVFYYDRGVWFPSMAPSISEIPVKPIPISHANGTINTER